MDESTVVPGDLLLGAEEIAGFLREQGMRRVTKRTAFHLCESGQIPVGKMGGRWLGSRRVIADSLAKIVRGEAA